MKVVRFFAAVLFLVAAVAGYGLFEYLKLLESGDRYLLAGAGAATCFFLSFDLFTTLESVNHFRTLRNSVVVTLLITAAIFGLLDWHSRTPLNRLLGVKSRCESFLMLVAKDEIAEALLAAQDSCRLRIFQETLKSLTLIDGEERIVQSAKYLQDQGRLSEVALVILMAAYSEIQEKRFSTEPNAAPIVNLQNQFAVLEAEFSLIAVYNVKEFDDEELTDNAEQQKLKKVLELSTLGRTLHVLVKKTTDTLAVYQSLAAEALTHPVTYAPELLLLQIRAQKLTESFNRLIIRWNLAHKLEVLKIKDTYPQKYQKLLDDVTFIPL